MEILRFTQYEDFENIFFIGTSIGALFEHTSEIPRVVFTGHDIQLLYDFARQIENLGVGE